MRLGILVIVTAFLITSKSRASQERYLAWSEIRVVSPGIEDSGEVSFIASVNDAAEWKKVELSAFGQQFTLDEKQRASLKGYPAYRIVNTYERGYQELGGHTVHWKFKRIYRDRKQLMEQEIVLSVSKGKGLRVHEWEGKPADQ